MQPRNMLPLIFGGFLVLAAPPLPVALAQTPSPAQPADPAETVQLTPGFTKLLRFDRPVRTVVIGNPEVADARAQTDRAIVLVGRAVGITNIIVLDETGTEVYTGLVIVGARDAGKVVVHARGKLHEYWAYRCTLDNCVRVEDRLEYLQPSAPIFLSPGQTAPPGQPQAAAPN